MLCYCNRTSMPTGKMRPEFNCLHDQCYYEILLNFRSQTIRHKLTLITLLQHKTYSPTKTSLVLSQYVTENNETPQGRSCSKSAISVIEIIIISYRITTYFNYFYTLIFVHITYYVPSTDLDLSLSTCNISKKL